jgi:hypothetical protein
MQLQLRGVDYCRTNFLYDMPTIGVHEGLSLSGHRGQLSETEVACEYKKTVNGSG